jgi:class 3 adenylate cyclase
LLTDIAGFSAYVDEVSTARPSGLEELARDFNGYFTDLVGVVYGHGGDVVAIAGDAFFSYWPAAADEGLAGTTLRAAQAGLELQRSLGDPARPAAHRFQTRAGLSAGEPDVALLGGIDSRWEVMPVGRPIDEVARAERLAAPGTVALSEPAWQLIASHCEGRPGDHGLVTLDRVVRPLVAVIAPRVTLTSADVVSTRQ